MTTATAEKKITFRDLGLSEAILKAIDDMGYEHPTPIQEAAIPPVLMMRDLVGIAQTGTGKTASFTLPMIEILAGGRVRARMPRSLVLAPTRELAMQVSENFEQYGKYLNLNHAVLVGGISIEPQIQKLERGVDVLIATPGRLLDLFERGNVLLADIKILVIDEADRMLDMGFIPDIEKIIGFLPVMRQTLLFSATMADPIRKLSKKFMMNPKEVSVALSSKPTETVDHVIVEVSERNKKKSLVKILSDENVTNAFIFCNRKRDIDGLKRSLEREGFKDVAALHGDMDQHSRTRVLDSFKSGETKILVCSDVAGRGLDVAGISHVFNYNVPHHAEDYIHRIGRTGRAGLKGKAFTFATPEDVKYVENIEKLIKGGIPRFEIAGGKSSEGKPVAAKAKEQDERKPSRTRNAKPAGKKPPQEKPAQTDSKADSREKSAQKKPVEKQAEKHGSRNQRPVAAKQRDGGSDKTKGFGEDVPDFFR
jgi:superfamily II DNA/RNA helicase